MYDGKYSRTCSATPTAKIDQKKYVAVPAVHTVIANEKKSA